jgi:hypothetical protein
MFFCFLFYCLEDGPKINPQTQFCTVYTVVVESTLKDSGINVLYIF